MSHPKFAECFVSHSNLCDFLCANVFVSHEACSLLPFLRNASVIHPNHMSDYIYCVYDNVSKMHRKSFFLVHLILFFERFHLKVYFYPNVSTPCYLLDACLLTYWPEICRENSQLSYIRYHRGNFPGGVYDLSSW